MRPLAHRMRPNKIEEVIGQKHLLGENKPIQRMVENKQLSSMILFGPPGIGKTTIAQAISGSTDIPFRKLNAVTSGKKDLEAVAKETQSLDTSLLLYVDEIHRYTKTQIEYLLPFTESGDIILIGSTTESVFHSLPKALLSRSRVFQLKPLSPDDILEGLKRAIQDVDNGLGKYEIEFTDEALLFLSETTGGDMRFALNTLESIVISNLENNKVHLSIELIEKSIDKKNISFSGKTSEYDFLSYLHKSVRGSDVDGALLATAMLLESGNLESLCRRIRCICDEDIGLANINLSSHVYAATEFALSMGMPEARIPIARIIIEMCLSPKSDSALSALDSALSLIRSGYTFEPPIHLRDAHYAGAKQLGIEGYKYPHNFPVEKLGSWVYQQYLPDDLEGTQFYHPKEAGHERSFADMYQTIQKAKQLEKKKKR